MNTRWRHSRCRPPEGTFSRLGDLLWLSDEESGLIEVKLELGRALRTERTRRRMTQAELSRKLGSRQSRIAKMESGDPSVIDGPFAETKELVAGYWIWQVKSMEEAVEWMRRCPSPMPGEESEIEIRPIFEAEDFGEEFTPELRAQAERIYAELSRQR